MITMSRAVMRRALCQLPLAASVLFLSGCMVGPKYTRPAAPVPPSYKEPLSEGFKEGQGWKQAQPSDAVLRGKWWELYNDSQLNSLEEQVTISNQNVLAAEAQFRESRDLVRVARASLFPSLSVGPSIVNSQSSANLYGSGNAANTTISRIVQQRTLYNLPFDLSWTADVWGSIRRNVNANVDAAQATEAQLENARLSYQATLAQDYFELHGIDGDIDLLDRTAKSYEEFLQLTKDRFSAGIASDLDVAEAETQLNTTRAQLVDFEVARAQFEHAIAVLTGKPPSGFSIPRQVLSSPPPAIPVAFPSTLLERRPDIAAAERQMAAANEQIGIATAAFYPTVSLSGVAGLESAGITDWFAWPSKLWSVGPTASETIFDAGRRRATLHETRNAYEAVTASYRQTVLTAFQQVEDNLAALRVLSQEAETQALAVGSARRALDVSTLQYKAGTADYLQVITSQATALANERTAIDLLTRRLDASVLLIEALGGGWSASNLPNRDAIINGR